MNDPTVVICKEEIQISNDPVVKQTTTRFFKKDKTSVDRVTNECILPYIEATEIAQAVKHQSDGVVTTLSLKDIVVSNNLKISFDDLV